LQLAIVLYLKVMDNWQTQNKSVGCIPHLPSVDMQVVEAYDELMTYDNLSLEFVWNFQVGIRKLA